MGKNNTDTQRGEQYKKTKIAMDLAEARRLGQTYNQMHASERERGHQAGELNDEAYKAGEAYEMYTPKEVKKEYDKDPQYFERAKKANRYAKGGSVKSAARRGDGRAQKGRTKGRFV